jgi:hypothetical protein
MEGISFSDISSVPVLIISKGIESVFIINISGSY